MRHRRDFGPCIPMYAVLFDPNGIFYRLQPKPPNPYFDCCGAPRHEWVRV